MNSLIELKFILFDFDGVLVDSINLHAFSTLKAIEKSERISLDSNQKTEIIKTVKSYIGKPFDEILAVLEKMVNVSFRNPEKVKLLKRKIFLENLDKVVVLPCVYSTLDYIKRKNIHIGIASLASRATLQQALKYKNLERYFDVIVSFEDVDQFYENKKSLYNFTIRKIGCKPHEGILIGDTPADIIAGKEARILSIGVTTGVYTKEHLLKAGAYKVFNNLCEFLDWMITRFNF